MKGIESLTRTLPENSDREILTPEAVEMPFDAFGKKFTTSDPDYKEKA